MMRSKHLIDYLVFTLLFLLGFFLFFESYLKLPGWLQVSGRMHPLLLHLPIGFLALLALLPLLNKQLSKDAYFSVFRFVLNLAAISAVCTALAGLFLAQESGYQSNMVNWHKWTGVALSLSTYTLLLWHKRLSEATSAFQAVLYINTALMIWVGHLGGSITHGEDFILEPVKKMEAVAFSEEMSIYNFGIKPILQAKCVKCHKESKSKGELLMTSPDNLLQGGEKGVIWIPGNSDSSRMIQYIHLPEEDDLHMPPKDQPQLSDLELKFLEEWINAGADLEQAIGTITAESELGGLINQLKNTLYAKDREPLVNYDFEPAKTELLERLNTPFRRVASIANGSPALAAEFFVQQAYQPNALEELLNVKEQLVSLNLTNMPIGTGALKVIGQFSSLERLILNGTDLKGGELKELLKCTELKELALSSTEIEPAHLKELKPLINLQKVFAWNTSIDARAAKEIEKDWTSLQIDLGFQADPEEQLQLSPPVLKNKTRVIASDEPVVLENRFPGAVIRYTSDGSEPDSLNAPVFEEPIYITRRTKIKAKVFNENWVSSDLKTFNLYAKGIEADTVLLLTKPNPRYTGSGAMGLKDASKGDITNFKSPAWLGFMDEPLKALFDFGENAPEMEEIVLCYGQNMGAYIFPPGRIKIWGGNEPDQLKVLNTLNIPKPEAYGPNQENDIVVELPKSKYRYYQVEANPYDRLPRWHNAFKSGSKTWVFVDEIFFY